MRYKLKVHLRAQVEIEVALAWYAQNSQSAAKNFLSSLELAYQSLGTNPYFEVKYNNIRSLKLARFPYSLYFIIDEPKMLVSVLACFHHHRNPSLLP